MMACTRSMVRSFTCLIGGLFSVTRLTVTHDAGRLITLAWARHERRVGL